LITEKFLFTYRKYIPVPFIITAVVLANPRQDLVVFGALLMIAGEILRLAAASFIGPVMHSEDIITNELVTNGPYAYLRNPIYFGNILLYAGASILSGAWLPYLLYLIIIFFSIHFALCIRYEESHLSRAFGQSYEDYQRNVPRFFPRLSAFPNRGNKKADVKTAFQGEVSVFLTSMIFLILVMIKWFIVN
jgi:protein-S-isoprenylcysteine O-methyltransferase Ste14